MAKDKSIGFCVACGKKRTHGKTFCSYRCSNTNRQGTPSERFWKRVDKTDPSGCWLWTGRKQHGYGQFDTDGDCILSHRYSWGLANGTIPDGNSREGLCVLHKCDVPACVNPSHLFLGTHIDNMNDKMAKGRAYSRLTRTQAMAIKQSPLPLPEISATFGISKALACMIKSGKRWRLLNS